MALGPRHRQSINVGGAWFLLSLLFAVHTTDEAFTDFIGYYNATVLTLYGSFSWFPRIDLSFREWLIALVALNSVLMLLTPVAYRNSRFVRSIAYAFASAMLLDGLGHVLLTLRGRTVGSAHFSGTSPGFYSAPLLLAGAVFLLVRLRSGDDQSPE